MTASNPHTEAHDKLAMDCPICGWDTTAWADADGNAMCPVKRHLLGDIDIRRFGYSHRTLSAALDIHRGAASLFAQHAASDKVVAAPGTASAKRPWLHRLGAVLRWLKTAHTPVPASPPPPVDASPPAMTDAEVLDYWQSLPRQDHDHLARWLHDIYTAGGRERPWPLHARLRQEVQLHRLHHEPPEQ